MDGDGDLDAFIGRDNGVTRFFKNTGSTSAPAFLLPVTNPYGLTDVGFYSSPSFADVDGDGDLDAFIGRDNGVTRFFENTGSSSAPAFSTPVTNPFGLTDVGRFSSPSFADVDGDGDLDAFIGEDGGATYFFKNTGSTSAPAFSAPVTNPYGLTDVGYLSTPSFADLDGDGDFDAFIGNQDGATYFFENIDTVSALELTVSLWLEGPFATNTMTVALSADLPETDPYFGTASVTPDFFTTDPTGQQVIDWIWLELRTGDPSAPPMTTVAETAALLLADGTVVASDGTSAPVFAVAPGSYYVVVGHRNHVAVMSASALDCSIGSCSVDFQSNALAVFGGSTSLADLGGAFGLLAGDGTGNAQVQNDDKNVVWASEAGQAGYRLGDFNLNAEVQNDDKNELWSRNVGKGTQVPASSGATAQQ